jgi:hypothetical protein
VARLVLGTVCVAVPHRVLAAVGGPDQENPRATGIARVLGTRLLLQGGLDAALGPRTRRVDMAVELAHAASMVPAAWIWPTHRRSALVSAACATGISLLDLRPARGRLPAVTSPKRPISGQPPAVTGHQP